jgi:transposase
MSYPIKFREIVLNEVRKGKSKKEVTEKFNLGANTIKKWEKLEKETGKLTDPPRNKTPHKINLDELHKYCDANPFNTHIEAAAHFNCSESAIRKAKKKLRIKRKKRLQDT